MSLRDGLKGYYSVFGLRGVLAISAYRAFGWPVTITVHPSGIQHPVHLRVRTTDPSTYSEILRRGEYDFDLPISPKTIVDAGANIGMASIFFAHKYPSARIAAVEAEPSNFAMLAENVRPYPAIVPIHAALWNRDGEISVCEPTSETGAAGKSAFITREGPGLRVRAITLPTLLSSLNLQTVDLLKVDIEGAEKEVFEDCTWMDKVGCLMIELHDRLKAGCSASVASATKGFLHLSRRETVLYIRESSVSFDKRRSFTQ